MKTRPLFNFIILSIFIKLFIISDLSAKDNKAFYFDAIVFRSDKDSLARLDVYTVIPWETLNFLKTGDLFGAKYTLVINVEDSTGQVIADKKIDKTVRTDDYFRSQGSDADYERSQNIFYVPKGDYKVTAIVTDEIKNTEYKRSRSLTVLNFSQYSYSMSGLMLVSSIEESGGKYKITPHASDNVGGLDDGFFVFFEIYNDTTIKESDFVYTFSDKDGKTLFESKRIRKSVDKKINRLFLKIALPENAFVKNLVLRVISLTPSDSAAYNENDYLAISQRTIRYEKTLSRIVLKDIDKAIRQLRYAATGSEIDHIEEGSTEAEKLKRFEEFWNKHDPTPNTKRNEAFDEFYSRVEFANKNFKSYTEGWLTDKGHVFIVFGQPYNIERYQSSMSDNRIYEKWTYLNNYEFVFYDRNGFGDFRLVRPVAVTEKYKYRK